MLVHVFCMYLCEFIYSYRRAFDVACFDNSGNAKTSIRGTSDSLGSTFFLYLYYGEKYKMIAIHYLINKIKIYIMTVKKLCWSVLTFLVVALMGMSFVSCGSDDEGDVSSLSETQIKSLLEAGSGQWTIRENDGENVLEFVWVFKNGTINSRGLEATYSVSGGVLKLVNYNIWDFLEGGYVITKIDENSISGYWQGNKSNTFTGIKK